MGVSYAGGPTVLVAPAPTASSMAPAIATYGPSGATVVTDNGISPTEPAQFKVFAGFAALGAIIVLRQIAPAPHKRTIDTVIGVGFLLNVAYTGLKMNAKRRVQEGKTSGISGFLAQAWAI